MPAPGEEKIVFGMKESEWTEFSFFEHQLGVLDTKANNVLMTDSVLIIIITLTSLFQTGVPHEVKEIASLATVTVLVSVIFCIRVIWTTWAVVDPKEGAKPSREEVIRTRNVKTFALKCSLIVLVISLILYIAALVIFGLQ